jgi:hypothetical protein
MLLNGLPALAGAVPTNMTNSALALHRKAGLDDAGEPVGRDAEVVHFAPDHLEAAEGAARHGGEAQAREIGEAARREALARDHQRADGVRRRRADAAFERGEAGEAVARFEPDIIAGVGDGGINLAGGDGAAQPVEIIGRKTCGARQRRFEMAARRLEVAQRPLDSAIGQHAHAQRRLLRPRRPRERERRQRGDPRRPSRETPGAPRGSHLKWHLVRPRS